MMTPEAWGAFLEGQDLLLQSGELQYPQRVVFQQETSEGVPAATDAHHHMFAMKHPNEDGLISESVASLRQVLDGHSVRAVAGWVVHVMLPRLVEATVLATHAEGFDRRRRLLCQEQSLLHFDLLLQLHQHRRLHAVLGDDATGLQQTEANLSRLLVQHEAFRLKQVGLLHTDVSAPGQEVGGVVASKEGAWRGIPLACYLPCRKQLAKRRGAALSDLSLQHTDKLAELHTIIQVLHESLGSHLLSQHASEPYGQVLLHGHQRGLVPHRQPLVILEDICEAGAVPLH